MYSEKFDFNNQINFILLGPNAGGKSTFVDGIDIALSKSGILTKFNRDNFQSDEAESYNPLVNCFAEMMNLPTHIELDFSKGRTRHKAIWKPSGKIQGDVDELDAYRSCITVPLIIRGYELRQFVEFYSSARRFDEVIGNLQLNYEVNTFNLLNQLVENIPFESTQEKVSERFSGIRASLAGRIVGRVQDFLERIKDPLNEIYSEIQGCDIKNFRMKLQYDNNLNQFHIPIFFDYNHLRKGILINEHLSDAQLHSLALAIKIASIEEFNIEAPLVIMDDVVVSYDAEYRYKIASFIAKRFRRTKIPFILTTHDERLFSYLRELIVDGSCQFREILRLDKEGPVFRNAMSSDEEIQFLLESRISAANHIRKALEAWVKKICEEFKVELPYKRGTYTHKFLVSALTKFLLDAGLITHNDELFRFLKILKTLTLEHFGSHSNIDEYGTSSIGDERSRWKYIVQQRDKFKCSECQGAEFTRHIEKKENIPCCKKCNAKLILEKEPL